jgi:hypothetical protein
MMIAGSITYPCFGGVDETNESMIPKPRRTR